LGFSASWLALREPADLAARNVPLLRSAVASAGPDPVILDLGCGTGATMRAFAPSLDERAQWRLVDNDEELLQRAVSAGGNVETVQADLTCLDSLPMEGVTLVTASALLDLVSETWLLDLAERLNAPIYATLIYDGEMKWEPEHPNDAAMTAAFNAHQLTDKGFGPALGPNAASRAQEIFEQAGFDVTSVASPWHLAPEMSMLQRQLTDGIARAAEEAGATEAKAWGDARRADAARSTCIVGHRDVLAIPMNRRSETAHATG
jgi:hypothetical protein